MILCLADICFLVWAYLLRCILELQESFLSTKEGVQYVVDVIGIRHYLRSLKVQRIARGINWDSYDCVRVKLKYIGDNGSSCLRSFRIEKGSVRLF